MLAILALLLVQMFYGVTFTFANEVIDGGYILPFGFIVLRVFFAGILFWLFDSIIKTRKIEGKQMTEFGLLKARGIIGFSDVNKTIQNTELMSRIINYASDIEIEPAVKRRVSPAAIVLEVVSAPW